MRSGSWQLKEWAVVALLLVFAAVLIMTGVAERDADLVAGGLAIALAILGGLVLYLRITGLVSG